MAERLAYLEAVVGADITQFRKGMRDVRNDVGILSETIGGIGKLGRTMTFAVTAPLLALGSYAVQAASQFDASMHNINAIAGLTGEELDLLSQKTLEFGNNTRDGAIAASEALYTVYSAGITGAADAFMVMEWSVRTAEAGLADMTVTTQALVASMLAYDDVTEEFAERASNALTAMVAVGVGSMEEFAGSIGDVLPSANALGMSIEELYGDLAYLTQRGLSASKATTAFSTALDALVKPTTAMSAAFRELGVRGAEELIEQFGGVNGALQAIMATSDGTLAAMNELFGNKRGAKAMNSLMNNIDGWNASMEEFNTLLDGATMRAWEEQSKSFAAQWDMMTSALQGAAITIGTKLLPVIAPLVGGIADFFNNVSALNPELLTLGMVIAGVVAATGPLLWIFASLLNPVGLVLGAIIGLGAAFAKNFNNIRTTVSDAVTSVVGDLSWVTDVFDDLYGAIFPEDDFIGDFAIAPVEVDTTDILQVTAPTSLFTIFEREGYDELFGWHEFMRIMEAAGWEGGALTPEDSFIIDLGEMVVIEGVSQELADELAELTGAFDDTAPASNAPGLWTRLLGTWEDIEPVVTENLTAIAGAIVAWGDEQVGKGLNLIAAWFTPGSEGTSPLTDVLTNLLEGDFAAAIDIAIPGAGTHLKDKMSSDWPAKIEAALPDIVAGIGNLVRGMGTWLVDEGIPLFSEKAGYFIGKIGTIIMDGMGKLNDWLFGGGEGEGNASSAAGYVEDSVISPFSEGFNQAMSEADVGGGLSGWADGLVALIAGALGTAFLVQAAFSGVTSALTTALGLAMTAAKLTASAASTAAHALWGVMAAQIAAKGGAKVVVTAMGTSISSAVAGASFSGAAAGVLSAIGTGMVAAGTAATGAVASIGTALSVAAGAIATGATWVVSAAASIAGAIAAGIAAAPIAVGIAIGSLLYVLLPDDFTEDIRNTIARGVEDVFGEGTMEWWNEAFENNTKQIVADIGGVVFGDDFEQSLNETRSDWGEALELFQEGEDWDAPLFFTPEFIAAHEDIDFSAPFDELLPIVEEAWNAYADEVLDFTDIIDFDDDFWEDLYGDQMREGQQDYIDSLTTDTDEVVTVMGALGERYQEALDTFATGGRGVDGDGSGIGIPSFPVPGEEGRAIGRTLFDTDEIAAAGQEAIVVVNTEMTAMGVAFLSNMGEGSNLDAQRINTEFLIPLEQHWLDTFGTEGDMYTTMSTFSEDIALDLDDIGAAFARMHQGIAVNMPYMVGTLETEMPKAIAPLQAVKEAALAAADAINALLSISGTISIEVTTTTGDDVDGSHAGGLGYVPYDGYIAELHKGERVLTEAENREYGNIPAAVVAPPASNTTNNTATQNTIYIQSDDVDGILRELERRGIYIDN